jgi:hypothetical protein
LAFNSWDKALKPSVEVIPVEVANRERFAMPRQLVDLVNAQLGSTLDQPHMDAEYIGAIYREVENSIQAGMDRLAERRRFPIFG